MRRCTGRLLILWLALQIALTGGSPQAAQLWLKDGRVLEGRLGLVAGLADVPKPPDPNGSSALQLIAFVDDGLRRTFVSKRQIREFRQEDSSEILQKYRIRQQVMRTGPTVAAVGPIVAAEPFDQYGRRLITMNTARGPVPVIQCITEITPVWTKVEGHTHVWDMRIATSSIPPDTLAKILAWQTNPKNLEDRKSIVRFYLQAERYEQALAELEAILKEFPDEPGLAEQLEATARRIRQLSAQRLLDELKLRRSAGQHQLVADKLRNFPSDGVAGSILEEVRQMLDQYAQWESQRKEVIAQLEALLPKVADSKLRLKAAEVCKEIAARLSYNTLDRMAPFHQMLADQAMPAEEKLALALSGWLRGASATTTKLPLAVSMYEVRQLIVAYVQAEDRLTQRQLFDQIRSLEAGTPQIVAALVARMEPPLPIPPESAVDASGGQAVPAGGRQEDRAVASEGASPAQVAGQPAGPAASVKREGFFRLQVVPLPNSPPVEYLVQLPPEYDPLRRYPTIVTLHGAGSTPEMQMDFWAGPWTEGGWRFGQATRHGYIVIAPAWAAPYQKDYQYTMREHAAVLRSLRDACRRLAIDTDRVFLTGHSMGGDAAWDIGLAHPDLWAGVIPIAARSDRFCPLYWQNAEFVPFYFVGGELDGDRTTVNARDFDRYLRRGFNATVVEFLGRGHEFFSDEIHRMFDWMSRASRNFFPREFTVRSMRRWDSFFWWLELESLPAGAMVDPADWPPRTTQPMEIRGKLTPTNTIYVTTGAGLVRIFASPEMFDFGQRVSVILNGRRIDPRDAARSILLSGTGSGSDSRDPFSDLDLQLETILEDVRTRSDRLHPFWVRMEIGTGQR